MRCFIAVDVDASLRGRINELVNEIRGLDVDVKFVEEHNLHFTINFIGDVKKDEVDEIKNSLAFLADERDFKININGLGYFGSERYLRTLWVGVKEGNDKFTRLMKIVNENVNVGKGNISPHMTLGRVRSRKNVDLLLNFMKEHENVKVGEMSVKNVKLKSSNLTGNGPVYEDIAVFDFRGEEDEGT